MVGGEEGPGGGARPKDAKRILEQAQSRAAGRRGEDGEGCRHPGPATTLIGFVAVLVATGVLAARFFSAQLSGGLLVGTLSFATAALLYLVVEELLVEAHREEDRIATPAFFFAGFLLLYVLQHWLGG